MTEELCQLEEKLRAINESLWSVEEELRVFEKQHSFGDAFVAQARRVYRLNDERTQVKRRINELLNSKLNEEKSY